MYVFLIFNYLFHQNTNKIETNQKQKKQGLNEQNETKEIEDDEYQQYMKEFNAIDIMINDPEIIHEKKEWEELETEIEAAMTKKADTMKEIDKSTQIIINDGEQIKIDYERVYDLIQNIEEQTVMLLNTICRTEAKTVCQQNEIRRYLKKVKK